jgi:phosphoribosylformimino-5-aminoimidazole carboxamide ribotide isomerase
MVIIPAIDIKDGKCVRLLQGRADAVTIYSGDPAGMAKHWASSGAEMLHLVDLDGAFTGKLSNLDKIIEIRKAVNIKIEVGGGIRDIEQVKLLISNGIDRVILGTSAAKEPAMVEKACKDFPGKIFVSIDAKEGRVATEGWLEVTDIDSIDFAIRMQETGVAGIIYTDIVRDGMMTGPNIQALEKMVHTVDVPVIASGGISGLDDIKNLLKIKKLWGVITGKALYEGRLELREAINLVRSNA